MHRQNHTFNITIEWDSPTKFPDKYIIDITYFRQANQFREISLPGNATEYNEITPLLGNGYEVIVYGITKGGRSKPAVAGFHFNVENIRGIYSFFFW